MTGAAGNRVDQTGGSRGGMDCNSLSAPGRQPGELERVQMHGNRLRGVHYLPTRRASDHAEPSTFALRPVRNIALDGEPAANVRGGVYPIDVNGNGTFELLHFNGYRVMRAYGVAGNKLWQVDNPAGRVHRSSSHRDTLAIFDADGDGGQDIVHCWSEPGASAKSLVLRDGATGKVLKTTQLTGQSASDECQIAAFRVAGQAQPHILVAGRVPTSVCASGNYTDYFAKTYAFRPDLVKLWERTTCAAGHYAWPLDPDGDGRAESVFVGKYLLWPDGSTRCVLAGFGGDHVDSMVVADLDPARAGKEVLAVGLGGTRFYSASTCTLRWTVGTAVVKNPQQTAAAFLAADDAAPSMLVTSKLGTNAAGQVGPLYGATVSASGQVVGSYVDGNAVFAPPVQNANLDGAPAAEDRVTAFGQVTDRAGRRRLDTSWYWGLQRLTPEEQALGVDDQWGSRPVAFDLDNDGRDELVVWGRRKLVVGTRQAWGWPAAAPARLLQQCAT